MSKEITNFPFFHPYSRRFHLTIILMLLYFSANYMKSNLGMAMTCMINSTALAIDSKVSSHNLSSNERTTDCGKDLENIILVNDYGGSLEWSSNLQDWLFTATSIGTLISTLPGAYLITLISPKNVVGLSIFVVSLSTLVFPFLAIYSSYYLVFLSRLVLGIGLGPMVSAMDSLIVRWVPNTEKGLAVSVYSAGVQIAGFIGAPFTVYLCASVLKWPAAYYLSATFAFFLLVVYFSTVSNSPERSKFMSNKEKIYLRGSIDKTVSKTNVGKIPWLHLATSLPLVSCYLCQMSYAIGQAFLQLYQPIFFKEYLFLPIHKNGWYYSITNIVVFVFKIIWSLIMERLNKCGLSTTFTCKLSQTLTFVITATCYILLGHVSSCSRPIISLLLFCGIASGTATAMNGYYTSMVSLAPRYTFIISSTGGLFANFAQLLTPLIVSIFRDSGSINEWRQIFYVMAGISLISGVLFLVCGSCEVQKWAKDEPKTNKVLDSTFSKDTSKI